MRGQACETAQAGAALAGAFPEEATRKLRRCFRVVTMMLLEAW
jgi:hypothetical protein